MQLQVIELSNTEYWVIDASLRQISRESCSVVCFRTSIFLKQAPFIPGEEEVAWNRRHLKLCAFCTVLQRNSRWLKQAANLTDCVPFLADRRSGYCYLEENTQFGFYELKNRWTWLDYTGWIKIPAPHSSAVLSAGICIKRDGQLHDVLFDSTCMYNFANVVQATEHCG